MGCGSPDTSCAAAPIVVADKNIKKAISFFISHYVLL